MAQIINGKEVAKEIREDIRKQVQEIQCKESWVPGLAVVLVGEDPASQIYVRRKKKACEELGIHSEEYKLPAETSQEQLLNLIAKLNNDPNINGILVQLPLPKTINEKIILESINPEKDVDGFHPVNVGHLLLGGTELPSCTPAGIMELIKRTGIEIKGKNAVVVGRSNIVGKPVALMLLKEHATVTICHSRTVDLPAVCRNADILVVAIGRGEMITGDYIKPGAVVIDVGMNRNEGHLVGDVNFAEASLKASAITPVPGGVGPMTIAMLMKNTLRAAINQHRKE